MENITTQRTETGASPVSVQQLRVGPNCLQFCYFYFLFCEFFLFSFAYKVTSIRTVNIHHYGASAKNAASIQHL